MLIKIKTYYQRGNPPYQHSYRVIDADSVRLIEPIGDLFIVHVGDIRNDNLRVDARTAAEIVAAANSAYNGEFPRVTETELVQMLEARR